MIANKVKEDCILCYRKGWCWTNEEAEYIADCNSRWQAELKTLEGWRKQSGDFGKYVELGDKIDKALYDYFLNILPPFELKYNRNLISEGFQCSEAINTGIDVNDNHRELYSTFGIIGGEHYYLGLNFRGEIQSRYHFAKY